MDGILLQRLKEGLLERKNELSNWLRLSTPESRTYRTGPAGEEAIHERLRTINSTIQKAEESALGLCTVCHDYVNEELLETDFEASVCIDHLTGSEKSLLENDLELSRKVQRALLPVSPPPIRTLEIAAFSQPAQIVGGDYFDYFSFRDGSAGFVIADVMGKGMAASLLMASIQASLRIIAPESNDPAQVMERLNRLFRNNIRLTRFVTVFLGRYGEGNGRLTYCNAGHNPPILFRRDSTILHLRPTGAAIGLTEQTTFSSSSIDLFPDDTLLAYTDGVVESRNRDQVEFGVEGIESFLKTHRRNSPQDLINELRKTLREFSQVQIPADDTTVIAIRVRGDETSSAFSSERVRSQTAR